MTSSDQKGKCQVSDIEIHNLRAQHILDAALRLILRYGYSKVTIDDIAGEAGIGKGTLYRYWNTREALFTALVIREKIAMTADIKQSLARDPEGGTLHALLKHAALALLRRPLLKGVLLRDTELFGNFIRREQNSLLSTEVLTGFTAYLEMLRSQGLVRTDLPLSTVLALFSSIFTGFIFAAPLLPETFRPADEELAELIAEAEHRTLEPREPFSPTAIQAASGMLKQYLDQSVSIAQEHIQGNNDQAFESDSSAASTFGRARGRNGGRPRKLRTSDQVIEARRMYAEKTRSIDDICTALGISRASLYRYIKD